MLLFDAYVLSDEMLPTETEKRSIALHLEERA